MYHHVKDLVTWKKGQILWVKAAKMNAIEAERRITLRVTLGDLTTEDIISDDFQTKILSGKCDCCGSEEHSLLRGKERTRTRSGKVTYEYWCPVAITSDLHTVKRKGAIINVTYYLTSDGYAKECQFDEGKALERLPSSCKSEKGKIFPVADAFINDVRRLCWEYGGQSGTLADSHC